MIINIIVSKIHKTKQRNGVQILFTFLNIGNNGIKIEGFWGKNVRNLDKKKFSKPSKSP